MTDSDQGWTPDDMETARRAVKRAADLKVMVKQMEDCPPFELEQEDIDWLNAPMGPVGTSAQEKLFAALGVSNLEDGLLAIDGLKQSSVNLEAVSNQIYESELAVQRLMDRIAELESHPDGHR